MHSSCSLPQYPIAKLLDGSVSKGRSGKNSCKHIANARMTRKLGKVNIVHYKLFISAFIIYEFHDLY